MAELTPRELFDHVATTCAQSSIVAAYTVRTMDLDILSLRVYLKDDSFIDAFYNVTTGKTAFALVLEERRLYGKDNAKMGWHVHPFDNPEAHQPCEPVAFDTFLAEVESLRFSSP